MRKEWNAIVVMALLLLWGAPSLTCASDVPYSATEPYNVQIGTQLVPVHLANKQRYFDFGGSAPFINSTTGVADIATINVWDAQAQQASVLNSSRIPSAGVAGRVFKTDGLTAIGYVSGDGVVEGKLRTQLNSYPIPARKHFVWELQFKLGAATAQAPWVITKRGFAPATIWQLKAPELPPTLVLAVDTDPTDNQKMEFVIDRRLDPDKPAVRLATIGGMSPDIEQRVRVEANLDERPITDGGVGFLRISFNEQLVVDQWGPVLQQRATQPYHWSLAMYLYANTVPLGCDRFVYFRQARMLAVN